MKPFLVFDMDGVLVDVTESYRETISRTVEHFTGRPISRGDIQDLKNQGGFNDDWKLSHHVIASRGVEVEFQRVVDYFQEIFHGKDGEPGLILRERWLARDGLLERLSERYRLAVFTGRLRWEAGVTLQRFAPQLEFDPVVGMEEVEQLKPHPDGLLCILKLAAGKQVWYVGDTVDDARCARAAGASFIGIAAPSNPRHAELVKLLEREGASAVLDDINGLERVLP
jgi:HAD superfamily phosphatase